MYRIGVVALFPELVEPVAHRGVVGRACERGIVDVCFASPRDHATDKHRTVDDRPYGGGPGMVLRYEPMRDAVRELQRRLPDGSPVVVMSAQGARFDRSRAHSLAAMPGLLLVAGRYEGIDERIVIGMADEELSIGDYVVSGGEVAAAVVIDAVTRLLPGVLGHAESADDSFSAGLLDYPQYTRPEEVDGMTVPEVLLSGDHAAVRRWRLKQALGRTWTRRRDMLEARRLTAEERELLDEFKAEAAAGRRKGRGSGHV